MKETKKEKIPADAWRQITEMEALQLGGTFNEFKSDFQDWAGGEKTDKDFVVKATPMLDFLDAVIKQVIGSCASLVDEVNGERVGNNK